nr:response regulator transcription factor [Microbacterium sp.]
MQESRVAVVVEDDADIRSLISSVLEQAGFSVFSASAGLDGIELVRAHDPVVTTLDVSMPGMDGYETAKRIRAFSDTYIVMLTARADEIDTLLGLQSGADDYVTKPFRPRELRARVEAMMRRPRGTVAGDAPSTGAVAVATAPSPVATAAPEDEGWLSHKGLRLHPDMRVVTVEDDDVELTRSEFDILFDLLSAGRRVVSKNDLALMLRGDRYVGGSDYVSEHDARAIEVHVANLRRKLGESAAQPRWIETIRGVGYRLTAA